MDPKPREDAAAAVRRNLVRLRTQRGWTQAEVARRTGFSTSTVGSHEAGTDIPVSRALVYADLYGVTLDALAGRPDDVHRVTRTGTLYMVKLKQFDRIMAARDQIEIADLRVNGFEWGSVVAPEDISVPIEAFLERQREVEERIAQLPPGRAAGS